MTITIIISINVKPFEVYRQVVLETRLVFLHLSTGCFISFALLGNLASSAYSIGADMAVRQPESYRWSAKQDRSSNKA
jgi:hypothetical protein